MIHRFDCLEDARELTFDASWRIAVLADSEYDRVCGKGENGAYTIRFSRRFDSWKMRMGDFADYAQTYHHNALMILPEEDFQAFQTFYLGHSCRERILRPDEPSILIHSTPLENWASIRRDGVLKSWNLVHQADPSGEEAPIGRLLGDPEDLRNYIMLGSGANSEIVVASKQAGKLVMNREAPYRSGARLYLDAQKIALDGLLIRDGNHLMVRDELPLDRYLLWAATWENIGLPERTTTPALFAKLADQAFEQKFPQYR